MKVTFTKTEAETFIQRELAKLGVNTTVKIEEDDSYDFIKKYKERKYVGIDENPYENPYRY